jgi:hypothetical protein
VKEFERIMAYVRHHSKFPDPTLLFIILHIPRETEIIDVLRGFGECFQVKILVCEKQDVLRLDSFFPFDRYGHRPLARERKIQRLVGSGIIQSGTV